jgi:hypothetical protein
MQVSKTLRVVGDVELKEVQLNSLNGQVANIIGQIVSIEIFEDLFSPFISLSIVLRESVDFMSMFSFVGEEFIDLEIVTPGIDKPIKGRFYVYKLTDRQYTKDKEVVYTIKAISEEFLADVNLSLSKSFSGNASEIASKLILKDGLNTKKKVSIDPSTNNAKFVSNYWNPTKCLFHLSSFATDAGKSPSFLFFENRDGFNFKSIDQLLTKPVYQEFVKDNYSRAQQPNSTTTYSNPTEDFKRILEFNVPVVSDYMTDIQSGKIKSRMITHDILTKKYTLKDYSIKKDPVKPTWLNKNPSYSKYALANAASTIINLPKHYNSFNNTADATNSKNLQRRMSFFQMLNTHKVNMQVYGRTDYTVGQIVDLYIPKATQLTKNESDPRDLILSGKYIISAISHSINRDKHICNIELVKNSVLVDLSKG